MLLLIDNYDSFVHNLARAFRELGRQTRVVRNDAVTVEQVLAGEHGVPYEAIVLSPGPCTPTQAGICVPLIQRLPATLPLLGVCLGHQAIAAAFGGRVTHGVPVHGRASDVLHDGTGLFAGLPNPLSAGRYHSLIVADPLPAVLQVDARTADGTIMALSHAARPLFGVQFHPESILTPHGHELLANFLLFAQEPAAATRLI